MADPQNGNVPSFFKHEHNQQTNLTAQLSQLLQAPGGKKQGEKKREVSVTGDVGTQQVRILGKIHDHEREHVFVSKLKGFTSQFDISLPIEYETFPPKKPHTGGMQSLKKLYRIGLGPSSSHTMGPRRAAEKFADRFPSHRHFSVKLYGSLAATGKGHLTDIAIIGGLPENSEVSIEWAPQEVLPTHTNGMRFRALGEKIEEGQGKRVDPDSGLEILGEYICYSVGGGSIVDEKTVGGPPECASSAVYDVYDMHTMNDMLEWCEENGEPLSAIVWKCEGDEMKKHLGDCYDAMMESIDRGLTATGALPGPLKYPRKACATYRKAQYQRRFEGSQQPPSRTIAMAYTLAVAEENGSGGRVVTAPTCGSCAVLPGTLRYIREVNPFLSRDDILDAMATAGLIGNVMKTNASISGAAVGCQGEIGTGCAMAAGAVVQLLGGTPAQVEYAAEMAIEHHLGMTCDPVEGLVQVPCIERCGFATLRALDCADYALMSDGRHLVSYDEVVLTLKLTGEDIRTAYRETAGGGLAKTYKLDEDLKSMKSNELQMLREKVAKQSSNCSTCGSSSPCSSNDEGKEEKELF